MSFIGRLFRKKELEPTKQKPLDDEVNRNYVCLTLDPIGSMNDLRVGDWNMNKVHESMAIGMLRYARQSEVEEAFRIGRIQSM
ncbi:hypothetical protein D3C76_1562490 [compost metagenome]